MTVQELIDKLNKIQDKNSKVFVYDFSDLGGWSELHTDFDVYEKDGKVSLVE